MKFATTIAVLALTQQASALKVTSEVESFADAADTLYNDIQFIHDTLGEDVEGSWAGSQDASRDNVWNFLNTLNDKADTANANIGDVPPENGDNLFNYIGDNHQETLNALASLQTSVEGEDGIDNSDIANKVDEQCDKIYDILRHVVESVEHIKDQIEHTQYGMGAYAPGIEDNTYQTGYY